MKRFPSVTVLLCVLTSAYAGGAPDDAAVVRDLTSATKAFWKERGSGSKVKTYEVQSVDRVYELMPRKRTSTTYQVYAAVRRTYVSKRSGTSASIVYWRTPWTYDYGTRKYTPDARPGKWEHFSKVTYWRDIARRDRSGYRLVYRSRSPAKTASNGKRLAALDLSRIPAEVAARDADVLGAKSVVRSLPSVARTASMEEFRVVAVRRRQAFLKAHYHVGRIEIRGAAAARKGKVAEKSGRLAQAIKKWASGLDTRSMAPPKPTMESVVLLEPPEEAFARRLAGAYSQQLSAIHSMLRTLQRQIVVDSQKFWRPSEAESKMVALLSDAQDQEDKGRMSLGGRAQVDAFAKALGRVLTPVLMELGRTSPASSAGEAVAKLAKAISEAEAGVVRRAKR